MIEDEDINRRLQNTFELNCPPPVRLGIFAARHLHSLLLEMKRESVYTLPIQTIGLELKVALLAIGGRGANTADNAFWLRKCRSLITRPAVEPLLMAHWSGLKQFKITEAQMSVLCSHLCGSQQEVREGESFGLWQGADVRFEPADRARLWLTDILAVSEEPELRSLLPAYAYARTIIAHPFPDGNGRLARALLAGSLAREVDLPAPIIALAPAFYKNAQAIAEGLRSLSRDGDWETFTLVFVQVLREAMYMSRSGWKIKN